MDQPLRVIEGAYFRDILDQPRALEQTLSKLQSSPSLEAIERHLVEGWYNEGGVDGHGLVLPRPSSPAPASRRGRHPGHHGRLVGAAPLPASRARGADPARSGLAVREERRDRAPSRGDTRAARNPRRHQHPGQPPGAGHDGGGAHRRRGGGRPSPARATWRPRRLSRGWEPCSSAGASTAHAATLPAPFLWSRPTWRTGAPTWTSSHRCWTAFVPSTTSDVGRRWQPWAPRVSSRRRPPTSRPREWAAQLSATALWRC